MNHFESAKAPAGVLYQKLVKPILSEDDGIDAELLSQLAIGLLGKAAIYRDKPGISNVLKFLTKELQLKDQKLQQTFFGCTFNNPVGLAAGFDKNGVAAGIWDLFGFGFTEIGTVTWHPQAGNSKPRLFRLAKEKAALNRMGFNNYGAKTIKQILNKQKILRTRQKPIIIGINCGKSRITSLDDAYKDYSLSFEMLSSFADYVVINVSSPNTPGLRDLQNRQYLSPLIKRIKEIANCPPLLVKISPDLSNEEINEIVKVAKEENLAGIIAVNTSLNRLGLERRILNTTGQALEQEKGGLSGSPLCNRALEVISMLYKQVGKEIPLIGVGGIESAQCAWERIASGASLIQIYTGWIYEGPTLVPQILKGLITQIDRHGFNNISEAVGSHAPWIK